MKAFQVLTLLLLGVLTTPSVFSAYKMPPYPFALGGTNASTQQTAEDSILGGSTTTGYVPTYNGTHWVAAAVPSGGASPYSINTQTGSTYTFTATDSINNSTTPSIVDGNSSSNQTFTIPKNTTT